MRNMARGITERRVKTLRERGKQKNSVIRENVRETEIETEVNRMDFRDSD